MTLIAQKVFESLSQRKLVLATAESCTGGMIASSITDISGSSAIFDRGFVTYSNESKIDMLGVDPELIAQHGAVSEHVARAMAIGALNNSNANIALSVTGIAGPNGGTEQKPVGLVFIGLVTTSIQPIIAEKHFEGSRENIRTSARDHALQMILDLLTQ